LVALESRALGAIRSYDRHEATLDAVLDAVLEYSRPLLWTSTLSEQALDQRMEVLRHHYRRTLLARPWEHCSCSVCTSSSVEVIIFRGSNRNKRRGIHNIGVFRRHLQEQLAA
jgi:hypothetical protein